MRTAAQRSSRLGQWLLPSRLRLMLAVSRKPQPPSASSRAAPESTTGRTWLTSRTIVRSGRTTWIVVGAVYSGEREAPGSSTGVSPALGVGATGWAKSAGVSPILALEGCG